jgi:phosphomannomutase
VTGPENQDGTAGEKPVARRGGRHSGPPADETPPVADTATDADAADEIQTPTRALPIVQDSDNAGSEPTVAIQAVVQDSDNAGSEPTVAIQTVTPDGAVSGTTNDTKNSDVDLATAPVPHETPETPTDRTAALLQTVRAWLNQDPDPETQAQLRGLINAVDAGDTVALSDLHSRFDTRLAFGTAGLRGEIAAGPNRMNRVLVSQAAAGLATYLRRRAAPGVTPSVVIGYDGRKNSHVFATDTAALMAGAGVRAILLPRLLPTPVLAFAVRHLDASCGVMVTASHNPPNDNGYKVYLGGANNGAQIVSPDDKAISDEILRVAADEHVPDLPRGSYETAEEDVVVAYVNETAGIAHTPRAQVNTVYTAMHGVGWDTTRRVLEQAGFDLPTLVDAQIAPDAAFPTVAFPNPEEPGAMDLAYETAREVSAELIIANDPDADRLAVAIPDQSSATGYRRLSGNEVGAILGWRAAAMAASPDLDADGGLAEDAGTLACSIVSSPALRAIADAYGLRFIETLTGFKWVSRVPHLVYGFEEALGYLVNPGTVRDKDGISAAVALLSLVSDLKAEGTTLAGYLDRFGEKFGYFASGQISARVSELSTIALVMTRLRESPPTHVGRIRVDEIDDFRWGFAGLPPSDVLRIRLTDGSRVMVRPSGTEPKLKVYIDTRSTVGTLDERRAAAQAALDELDSGMRALIA